ncbi:hypothetical protein [Terrimonas pollutisoli]|uniref:hypothetical protein n=1 Tax=Terrimonas pollutisoli TaxID=3034147 RepID=UPI0023EAE02E|nr:hypothetical protein [Terrimonas sp. H1YJ31]
MLFLRLFFLFALALCCSCQKETARDTTVVTGFEDSPSIQALTPGMVDEASGIADSKLNSGYIWVEQDSGNPNDLALLSFTGLLHKKINVKPAINRDWEDIVLAPGPLTGKEYIYIADIGDNSLAASAYSIYRFPEPSASVDTVYEVDKISFNYPDGPHDAEAMLVDHTTKDIYIITKQDASSRIYKLAYPQNIAGNNTAVLAGTLPFNGVTSAAISPDEQELLVKTYSKLYHWHKTKTQTIEQALSTSPSTIGYQFEPQGEAICFKNDNKGFFTLSERPSIIQAVSLNYYKRK